ncbi:MAG: C1 family peptidase [Bdellovibrionota bacterium]
MGNLQRICLALVGILSLATTANAAVLNASSLQTELKQAKAGWQPRDNWVNQLAVDQVKKMMGYPGKVRIGKDVLFQAQPGFKLMSNDAIDWRNKDGQNWVTQVLNQGNCGSCVAYATVGTLETQMNISHQYSWLNKRFSTDALFACGGGACEQGWYPSSAASFLQSKGVPDEACAPATMSATGVDIACSSICSDSAQRSQKISDYSSPRNAEAVKALLKHGPVVTTLDVYSDFVLYGSGIYKHVSGDYLGGHAVSIIGFNDEGRYWIIRNSWGPDWGENGFGRVSYDDTSGVGDETWGFNLPATDGDVAIKNLRDHDFISGNFAFNTVSTFADTAELSLQVSGKNGLASTVSCQATASCNLALDTTKMADGRYEATVSASHGGKTSTSERRYFYVVNKQPETFSLSFAPKSGLNLQAPIKDRVEFNITANSSSVPFTGITIVVKKNGNIVYTKGTDVTLPQMTMGWRTPTVPNGTYQISLVGTIHSNAQDYRTASNEFTVTVQN